MVLIPPTRMPVTPSVNPSIKDVTPSVMVKEVLLSAVHKPARVGQSELVSGTGRLTLPY